MPLIRPYCRKEQGSRDAVLKKLESLQIGTGEPAFARRLLAAAASIGDFEMVELVLGHAADLREVDIETAMRYAAEADHVRVVGSICERVPDCYKTQALRLAAERGNVEMMKLLLDGTQNPAKVDYFALAAAVHARKDAAAAMLLDTEAVTSDDAASSLVAAVRVGSAHIVERILSAMKPATVDARDGQALIEAAKRGDTEIMTMLLCTERSPHQWMVSRYNGYALVAAAGCGHGGVVRLLSRAEGSPYLPYLREARSTRSPRARTPTWPPTGTGSRARPRWPSRSSCASSASQGPLIEHGADVMFGFDRDGISSAMSSAIVFGGEEAVQLLLDARHPVTHGALMLAVNKGAVPPTQGICKRTRYTSVDVIAT
jgi:hypothetical protein